MLLHTREIQAHGDEYLSEAPPAAIGPPGPRAGRGNRIDVAPCSRPPRL